MDKLQIDDRGVEVECLEYPFNNWLAEQGKCNMLAGTKYITVTSELHREDSILIMMSFALTTYGDQPCRRGNDRDIRVKEWLIMIREAGVTR